MCDRGIKERQMRMTDDQQNHILHYRIVDPCDGTDIKYEGRTGSISDHFGVLQYFTDHGDEFRKYNDGALLRFCCGRTDPAFYQGQKKRKDGRGSTGACEPDEPKAGFPYGCFTDPAEYDIYPVFKSFCKSYPGFFRRRGRRKAVCSPVCSADPCIDPDGDRSGYVIEYEDHSKPGRRDRAGDRRLYS